jgi:hypothetical protein
MRNVTCTVLALSLLVLSGCAKLSDTRTQELKKSDPNPWALVIPPFANGVKVEATITSDNGTLAAALFPADKEDAAAFEFSRDKRPADALDYADNAANLNLTGTFAANQEGRLYIKNVGTSPATVKVTIVGR